MRHVWPFLSGMAYGPIPRGRISRGAWIYCLPNEAINNTFRSESTRDRTPDPCNEGFFLAGPAKAPALS